MHREPAPYPGVQHSTVVMPVGRTIGMESALRSLMPGIWCKMTGGDTTLILSNSPPLSFLRRVNLQSDRSKWSFTEMLKRGNDRAISSVFVVLKPNPEPLERFGSESWPNLGLDHVSGSERFRFEPRFGTGLRQHYFVWPASTRFRARLGVPVMTTFKSLLTPKKFRTLLIILPLNASNSLLSGYLEKISVCRDSQTDSKDSTSSSGAAKTWGVEVRVTADGQINATADSRSDSYGHPTSFYPCPVDSGALQRPPYVSQTALLQKTRHVWYHSVSRTQEWLRASTKRLEHTRPPYTVFTTR
ncbi:hypothetical protein P692DRAFT_201811206 [Suillus brevipes Sb2]|nr:hypothetical protein P692DRAFT_201811206 [Suillus brevipes Sb2]